MDIVFSIKNSIGHILLNRPDALNCINYNMARLLYENLMEWAQSPDIHAVVVQGAGDKSFSAGGDLREVYALCKNDDQDTLKDFFQKEYLLSALVHNYPKPYIAIMDGITMGGGMGLAIHGSHRIVTEHSVLAMPENRIGFFPDVGSAYFLNQAPGYLGMFLALTGHRMTPEDAMFSGLATVYIPRDRIQTTLNALENADLSKNPYESVHEILESHMDLPSRESPLEKRRKEIDEIFSLGFVEEMMESLDAQKDKFWYQILDHLETLCPVSLKVTHRYMKWAARKPIMDIIKMDYHLSQEFLKHLNFTEGIRALIIDKDNTPHWQPGALSEVTKEMVDGYF